MLQRTFLAFASMGAIAASLAVTEADEIELLRALPQAWASGRVNGLRARGAFEVDTVRRDGALTEATIRSLNGGATQLRFGATMREVNLAKDETYRWTGQ